MNIQFQPWVIKYQKSLLDNKYNVNENNSRSSWIVAWHSRFLFQHCDQLQDQEGNVANAKEQCEYSLNGTSVTLRKDQVVRGI